MISALVIVPVTLPLLMRLVSAEVQAEQAETYSKTAALGRRLANGERPPNDAVFVHMQRDGQLEYQQGSLDIRETLRENICTVARAASVAQVGPHRYSASCWRTDGVVVFVMWEPVSRSYLAIGLFILVLALVAGLANALGVIQLVRPLSRISAALDQVSAGARHVEMRPTGLAEVDDLIARLNATAHAVESRESEILARIQVIQEMARLVAHEVRNPLQSLTLYTQLLVDEPDKPGRKELQVQVTEEIHVINEVVERLLREGTTRGALRLQLEPVQVDAELNRLQKVRSQDAARRSVTLSTEADAVVAHLDRMLFVRAVQNLVSNALRAVPDGGHVEIRAHAEADQLIVTVDDDGPGVDPALGESIFELNVTGGKGHGLGLSLTRGVAEAHGGDASFMPSPLGGARFELRVPLHPISG